jgi:hypothetical protein
VSFLTYQSITQVNVSRGIREDYPTIVSSISFGNDEHADPNKSISRFVYLLSVLLTIFLGCANPVMDQVDTVRTQGWPYSRMVCLLIFLIFIVEVCLMTAFYS